MVRRHIEEVARPRPRAGAVFIAGVQLLAGCASPAEIARLRLDNESLRGDKVRLERTVLDRDSRIAALQRQVENLKQFDKSRPVDLFAPSEIEIASLSGGANYDNRPGDDGVNVYLRPLDADGDVVKVPGRITVKLTDPEPSTPRSMGVCVVDDAEGLRKSWYGRFGTDHYTIKCPFAADVVLPTSRTVVVYAEFADYLTGRTLTAVKKVKISLPDGDGGPPGRASD